MLLLTLNMYTIIVAKMMAVDVTINVVLSDLLPKCSTNRKKWAPSAL